LSCEEVLPPVKCEEPSTSEPEQETEQGNMPVSVICSNASR
jgi:hypothetical protein